jgi:hypothetical protein
VDEGEVDDAVRTLGVRTQHIGILEIAAPHLGAERRDRRGRLIRSREPNDLVTRSEELGHDGRSDPT